MNWFSNFSKNKTLVQNKNRKHKEMTRTLRMTMKKDGNSEDVNLRKAVKLPHGEDVKEWVAIQIVDLAESSVLIWSMAENFCTAKSCPKMTAGNSTTYLWSDGKIKPVDVPAKTYIENTFLWIDKQLNDRNIFPIDENENFPKNFVKVVSVIIKKMFRMYAHIYYSHFSDLKSSGLEANLNTFFKHLVFFISEYKLVKPKDLMPLRSLLERFLDDNEFRALMKMKKRKFD